VPAFAPASTGQNRQHNRFPSAPIVCELQPVGFWWKLI
jgi:hypothetical protein